jgi:hypothetical protein
MIVAKPRNLSKNSIERGSCQTNSEGNCIESLNVLPKGTPWNKRRGAAGNGLHMFPVSRSRIPKISEFCEKRNENPQTRFAQTVWIFVSTQKPEI